MAGGGMGAAPQQGSQGAPQPTGFGSMRGYRSPFSGFNRGYDNPYGGFGGDFGHFRAQAPMRPPEQFQPPSEVPAGGSTSRFTGETPPSGYRPMGNAPQFYQPVYQPQYMNYQSPFGGYGGFGGYGSPFGGYGGYGDYGSPFGGYGRMGGFDQRAMQIEPQGFDQRAIQANPEGFAQMMRGARQQEAQMPGSTFMAQSPIMGGVRSLWSQQSNPYQPLSFNPPAVKGSSGYSSGYSGGTYGGDVGGTDGLGDASSPSDASGNDGEGGDGGDGGAYAHGGIMRLLKK